MKLSKQAHHILSQLGPDTKLGDLRKLAKEIKKDHPLAMELWGSGDFHARQLAILIMDGKLLTQELIDQLDKDMQVHGLQERNHMMDWLMANQLAKNKKTIALIESWEHSPSKMQRRIFWYYQARLRWTGKIDHNNTESLLESIANKMPTEEPEVQWAMNFTAGQIGIWDERFRERCIKMGEHIGLYKDDPVPRNCTPNYLPAFIQIEVAKKKA